MYGGTRAHGTWNRRLRTLLRGPWSPGTGVLLSACCILGSRFALADIPAARRSFGPGLWHWRFLWLVWCWVSPCAGRLCLCQCHPWCQGRVKVKATDASTMPSTQQELNKVLSVPGPQGEPSHCLGAVGTRWVQDPVPVAYKEGWRVAQWSGCQPAARDPEGTVG